MPSVKRSKSSRGRVPLADEISATGPLREQPKKRKSTDEKEEEEYVDTKASRKILKISQDLVEEEDDNLKPAGSNPAFDFRPRSYNADLQSSDEEGDAEEWGNEDEVVEEAVRSQYLVMLEALLI